MSARKKSTKKQGASGPTAASVMTRKVTVVSPDLPISALVGLLEKTRFSGFPVVDAAGKPIGLISQNDVLRALAMGAGAGFQAGKRKAAVHLRGGGGLSAEAVLELAVADLMTPRLVACAPGDSLRTVSAKMVRARVHRVIVLERGKIVGLVSATDLVRQLAKRGG